MTAAVSFTVPGLPVAKARPRITTIGGRPRAFTPAKTAAYERQVRASVDRAMGDTLPMAGALWASVRIVLPVPASWSKAKRDRALGLAQPRIWPAVRPDLDNIVKAICDGANGRAWVDDAQIVSLTSIKVYGAHPCVEVQAGPILPTSIEEATDDA